MKFYTAGRDAMAKLGLEITPEMERVEPTYPVYLNDYYLGLIDPADWRNDPIARQSLPTARSLPTCRAATTRWPKRNRCRRRT